MATFALPSEVDRSTLDELHTHMVTFKDGYRNMHMRSYRTTTDQFGRETRRLRCLHILYAHSDGSVEGRVSGPRINVHFRLIPRATRAVWRIIHSAGDDKELKWLFRSFLHRMLQRARQERNQKPVRFKIKRTPGEFYVQRRKIGMASDHPTCGRALSQNVLDRAFVEQLEKWQFELLLG